ncbi:MAG: ATP-binding cassette domain-containing protein [Ruthenibacterium lactatiformans]
MYEGTESPDIVALHNVNLHIRRGEFVFVLGHSGAGKCTFLKLILREEEATEGRVIVNGQDLSTIKPRDIPYLRRGLGVVFQDFRLIPTMTAYENVAFAMRVTNIPEKQIKRRVPYVLNLVGLGQGAQPAAGAFRRRAAARGAGPGAGALAAHHHCGRAHRQHRPRAVGGDHGAAAGHQQRGHHRGGGHP